MKSTKKEISVPIDTGENRDLYGWDYEDRRVYGEPYSSFCNIDVMHGVVAMSMTCHPRLIEACYDPETSNILDAIPGGQTTFSFLPLMKMAMMARKSLPLEKDISVFVVYLCNLQTQKGDNLTQEEMEQALDNFLGTKKDYTIQRLLRR